MKKVEKHEMKNLIKQFILITEYTEMEMGTEEWLEMIAYVIGFEGDNEDLLDMDFDFDADEAVEILESLNVEIL